MRRRLSDSVGYLLPAGTLPAAQTLRVEEPFPTRQRPSMNAIYAGSMLLFSLNRLPGSYLPLIFDSRWYAGP